MKRVLFGLVLLVSALIAPSAFAAPASQPAKPSANNLMGEQAVVHRGAPFAIDVDKTLTLDAVAKTPDAFSGKTVRVSGKVDAVCKKKGCWLTLKGTATSARITFKDYSFFAPLDCQGTAGVVEGQLEMKKLSDDERKHLADDEGVTVDKVPQVELRLMATALEVRRVGH